MLDGINLFAALTLVFAAGGMVASAYALIWAIKPIIGMIGGGFGDIRNEDRFIGWSKEDEIGYQNYLRNRK